MHHLLHHKLQHLLRHLHQHPQQQGVSMAQPSHHHQRQPRSKPWRGRVFSLITLLQAASAAALRQKLVQFATVLHITVLHITVIHITVIHITVLHILQHEQPMVLGIRAFPSCTKVV